MGHRAQHLHLSQHDLELRIARALRRNGTTVIGAGKRCAAGAWQWELGVCAYLPCDRFHHLAVSAHGEYMGAFQPRVQLLLAVRVGLGFWNDAVHTV
jgi:hypothetical protein